MNPRFLLVLITALVSAATARAQHAADLWIGQSAGRVSLSPLGLPPGEGYLPLFRVDTFLHGWSNNNPGFDHLTASSGGASPLPNTSLVWLEVVELDAPLFVIDNSFQVLEFPGDRALLGDEHLHTHPTWFIDEDDDRFDAGQCVWEGTFRLVDTGSGLAASHPFTLLFANVPVRGGEFPPQFVPASGDFDDDGDTDSEDHAALPVCLFGPLRRPDPAEASVTTCEVDCHNAFDFDDDLDIDLLDVAEFQVNFEP